MRNITNCWLRPCFCSQEVCMRKNLFYNGSFELGKCGYSILRNYRPKVNPKLETNLPVLDSSTKVDGEFSLRIDNPYQEEYTLECREFDLPADVFVSISFYAKTTETATFNHVLNSARQRFR